MSQGPERQEQKTSRLFLSQKPEAQILSVFMVFPQDPTFSLLKVRGGFKHCFSRSAIFTLHPSSHQLTIKQQVSQISRSSVSLTTKMTGDLLHPNGKLQINRGAL